MIKNSSRILICIYILMKNNISIYALNQVSTSRDIHYYLDKYQYEILINLVLFCIVVLFLFHRDHKKIIDELNYDSLTRLLTEKKFMEDARILLNNTSENYCFVSIDIDNFKYLNSTMGYGQGTKLIKLMANHLRNVFGKDALICRLYGDQFLVLTNRDVNERSICGRDNCVGCVNDVLTEGFIDQTIVKTSVGIYQVKDRNESLVYMIDCANLARRVGKETYGHTRIVFDEVMEAELKRKNETIASMEKAVENKEFYTVFQPKVCLQTKDIVGCEALVRWNYHEKHIQPDHFIPLFEHNGFIKHVDYFVLKEVCKVIKQMDKPIKIAVNFSGATVLEEDFVGKVMGIVMNYQVSPKYIEIEITEGVFSKNFHQLSSIIKRLQEYGFTVAMDDFGSGVSSLNRLKQLDFDVLKIDKVFLDDTFNSMQGHTIIRSILQIAKALHMQVVVEGIETQSQCVQLNELGCDIGQGYYFSLPLKRDEFLELCKKGICNEE